MEAYHKIVQHILDSGELKQNRTGIKAFTVAGAMFEHNMATGFPLMTTKKMPFKVIASELEFFIKGITDKKWLQDRKNFIWNEWANPQKAPYGHSSEAKAKMAAERDLGAVYDFSGDILGLNMKIMIQITVVWVWISYSMLLTC